MLERDHAQTGRPHQPTAYSADGSVRQPVAATERSDGVSPWQMAREVIETIILSLVIFFLIRNFVQHYRVEGNSMEPNFHDRQFLIVSRFAYCPGIHLDIPFTDIHWQKIWCVWEPRRGDVIVFNAPDQDKDYIKRVIALPGETLQVEKGQVLINGEAIAEPYETRRAIRDYGPVVVGEGEVFVMGDNRPNSRDSLAWGPLAIDAIVGKALVSYWPPEHWSVVAHYSSAGALP